MGGAARTDCQGARRGARLPGCRRHCRCGAAALLHRVGAARQAAWAGRRLGKANCARTCLRADAQRRYVSKHQTFGPGNTSADSDGPTAAELLAPNPFVPGSGAAPAWQQRLCSAEQLARGLPPFRMLGGTCALTSRKVGSCCRHLPGEACRAGCAICLPSCWPVNPISTEFHYSPSPPAVPQAHCPGRGPPLCRLPLRAAAAGPRRLPAAHTGGAAAAAAARRGGALAAYRGDGAAVGAVMRRSCRTSEVFAACGPSSKEQRPCPSTQPTESTA